MKTNHSLARGVAAVALVASVLLPSSALAVGEAVGGFPNWQERVLHQWMNRARAAPATELMNCTAGNCGDQGCYMPVAPLPWNLKLGRAARFHSDEMQKQAYPLLDHNSRCTIVPNIDTLYPATCDGSAACACVGGMRQCSPACQDYSARVALFGNPTSGEIIAGGTDPNSAFYLWLYERATNTACMYSNDKGHRWNILKAGPSVGTGVSSGPLYGGTSVGDFGSGGTMHKLPSGTHYPQRGAQVEAWASYYDTAAPTQQIVNVDGVCTSMSLRRGSTTNGAYSAMLSGLNAATCYRYYFMFKDSAGTDVSYPTTGSLGIGPAGCADFSTARPGACGCTPQCSGLTCGDDGCGGTCGTCSGGTTCQAGNCVGPSTSDGGTGPEPTGDGGLTPDGALDGGCSCELGRPTSAPVWSTSFGLLILAGLLLRRRRRIN